MSLASGLLALILIFVFIVFVTAASAVSAAASAASGSSAGNCCHLRLILLGERRQSLVMRPGVDGGDRHLFRGEVVHVSSLEHLFVGGGCKVHITYVAPYSDWQLQRPQGKYPGGTTASVQLLGLLAHVLNQLGSKLGWEAGHGSTERLFISVTWLWCIEPQELCFDGEIYGGGANFGLSKT